LFDSKRFKNKYRIAYSYPVFYFGIYRLDKKIENPNGVLMRMAMIYAKVNCINIGKYIAITMKFLACISVFLFDIL